MIFQENLTIEEKLAILSDAAKYDVACTSSGVERSGKKGMLGSAAASGICHSFAADGRCISLLKILFTNECIYNCKYCINRCTNDIPRATFTPEEVCRLTIQFYRRNYIEGLFLSSGIVQSPDYTMELICQTLKLLRQQYHFNGYIHCKMIPGTSPELVEEAGWLADRMSVNLELPTSRGLQELAPNKSRKTILTPMRQIQQGMAESRELLGMKGGNQSAYWYTQKRTGRALPGSQLNQAGQLHGSKNNQTAQLHDSKNNQTARLHGSLNNQAAQLHSDQDNRTAQLHENQNNHAAQLHGDLNNQATQLHGGQDNQTTQLHEYQNNRAAQLHGGQDDQTAQLHGNLNNQAIQLHDGQGNQTAHPHGNLNNQAAQPYSGQGNQTALHEYQNNHTAQLYGGQNNQTAQLHGSQDNQTTQLHENLNNHTAQLPPADTPQTALSHLASRDTRRGFVPAGQSTQMIIGATGESDYEILSVTEALYQRFDLKRVFYSAFVNVNQDASLPAVNGQPPLRREHRLYQADFLLRFYGFQAEELLSAEKPFFNTWLDPKCDWALRHLELFPVEINSADYNTLLRVPGIGAKSARRIVAARRSGSLDYASLKKIGVVLKRAIYFITCGGRMMYPFMKIEEDYITRNLLDNDQEVMKGFGEDVTYRQLSLFDENAMGGGFM